MALLQPLTNLVQLCHEQGISQAVISPGSRSAALTLAFARNPHVTCTVVMDERAAGFIALGMAQQLRQPVALICTSGSAAYNFAPAVAEAFFQQIPLLVLTADRPPEWIHQNDGQTIYQTDLYGKHVKATYTLPADYGHPDTAWFINRSTNEALLTSLSFPQGPVHINIPIREPFYPTTNEVIAPSRTVRVIKRYPTSSQLDSQAWHQIQEEWESSDRILIAVGQHTQGPEMGESIKKIAEEFGVPVISDVLGNVPDFEYKISKQDLSLKSADHSALQPDLLITVGQSFISKQLKQFFRNSPPAMHWHISEDHHLIDTFQTLTSHIPVSPEYFFTKLFEDLDFQRFVQNDEDGPDEAYLEEWLGVDRLAKRKLRDYLLNLTVFNELSAIDYLLSNFIQPCQLHVANSMPIRYVNILGIDNQGCKVFCNRGTSGIDGCVSTAIGAALISVTTVYLLVGDVAFFYDRNGLLIKNIPVNLKIVLLNNSGGTIFRLIDGPASLPELETYFETKHELDARRTAEDSDLTYYHAATLQELKTAWTEFNASTTGALLEIKTNPIINEEVYKGLTSFMKE